MRMPRRCLTFHETGFTLIEALVAVLVLSFGLLGAAAMQLKSMQSAHASYQRSIASLIASDVQDRVWATSAFVAGDCDAVMAESVEESVNSFWSESGEDYKGQVTLPDISISLIHDSCSYVVELSWVDDRFADEEDRLFSYQFMLPGV